MGRKKKPFWPKAEEAWKLYFQRVGDTPKDHLRWALRQIETPPHQLTPADRENQRLEIAAFVARRPVPPVFTGVLSGSKGEVDAPTVAEVKEILDGFDKMLKAAMRREEVNVGVIRVRRVARWWDYKGVRRYIMSDDVWSNQGWALRARWALGRAIGEAGHLLKECPAPAPRGETGQTCGTWFVAKRPNQEYCSATCQSRASTRAARTGTDTPVMVKRRTQEQAKMRKPKQGRASR